MSECSGTSGGAIYSTISGSGKLTVKDGCVFTSCLSTSGNGGAIYADITSATLSQFKISGATFS
jgi:predicted outer membrane repeat protein